MEDLLGVGKGSEKLIDVIASAVGAIYKPYGIRREAEAEAYKLKLIESAKTEQKAEEIRILAEAKREESLIIDSTASTLEERATARKHFNELRRQKNLENVLEGAFRYVKDDASQEPVDPDWLQALIGYAEEANSEQMQDLWSRVLAGETELPGSFSLRSLETLKRMSRKDAEIFQAVCDIASRFKTNDAFMVVCEFENTGITSSKSDINLKKYKCGLLNRMTLDGIGLLHKDDIYCTNFKEEGFEMIVAGHNLKMLPKSKKSKFVCYNFTQVGSELAKLINLPPNTDYYNDFIKSAESAFIISDK